LATDFLAETTNMTSKNSKMPNPKNTITIMLKVLNYFQSHIDKAINANAQTPKSALRH
jgi:hypothetical protein